MIDRHVKFLPVLFSSCFLVLVVFKGHKGAALRVRSSTTEDRVNYYLRRGGRYLLPCRRSHPLVTKPPPLYSHVQRSSCYDNTQPSLACAAQTGPGGLRRCCMNNRVSVSRPPNLAFLTPSPDYVSEASLAGDWELRFYPDCPWEKVSAVVAGLKESSANEENVFLVALKELYRNPSQPPLSTARSPFAPLSRPCIQMKLQPNRLGIPRDMRFPPVVWQLKRRPYSTLYIELEMAFLPDNPQFMLVFEAPVSPGKHFPQAIYVQEGTVSFAVAPFLPWQKSKVGKFTLIPKTLRTIVDPVLL